MSEPFDLEDMRPYADRHRGKHVMSGPHWSLVLRFPILFDQYEETLARAETAERELRELRERTRWIPFDEQRPPYDKHNWSARFVNGVLCWAWLPPLPEPPEAENG